MAVNWCATANSSKGGIPQAQNLWRALLLAASTHQRRRPESALQGAGAEVVIAEHVGLDGDVLWQEEPL